MEENFPFLHHARRLLKAELSRSLSIAILLLKEGP